LISKIDFSMRRDTEVGLTNRCSIVIYIACHVVSKLREGKEEGGREK